MNTIMEKIRDRLPLPEHFFRTGMPFVSLAVSVCAHLLRRELPAKREGLHIFLRLLFAAALLGAYIGVWLSVFTFAGAGF